MSDGRDHWLINIRWVTLLEGQQEVSTAGELRRSHLSMPY